MSPGDLLLQVLSHRGTMPIRGSGNTFAVAADDLLVRLCEPAAVARLRPELNPFYLAAAYEELGFGQIMDPNIHVRPPALALLPRREPAAVLVGARDDGLIKRLREECGKREVTLHEVRPHLESQWPELMPTTFRACAQSQHQLKAVAEASQITMINGCTSWADLQACQSLDSFRNRLVPQDMGMADTVRESWFLPDRFSFSAEAKTLRETFSGLAGRSHALARRQPGAGPVVHYLYQSGAGNDVLRAVPVDGVEIGWSKWLAARDAIGSFPLLAYDWKLERLAVPFYLPLPFPLGRAMALCSGESPIIARTKDFKASFELGKRDVDTLVRLYTRVPVPFRIDLESKLGVKVADAELSFIKEAICETLSMHSMR